MTSKPSPAASPWPHRWAVVLACATFPLVWIGGLVTTTDAGMAVPDWPTTYGYNLFLYPWQTWLAGPWDLFIEYGHRLAGATVGLVTIGLLVVLWRSDERRWVRRLGVAALVLVVLQGTLGGLRVLLDEQTLAMVHGFTGPLFFALTVAIAVVTSRSWRNGSPSNQGVASGRYVRRLAMITAILFYLQIVVGSVLRHVPVMAEPTAFTLAVQFHLLLAAVLVVHVAMVNWTVLRRADRPRLPRRLAVALGGLLVVQVLLGGATWAVKYSMPYWVDRWIGVVTYTIRADGWLQTHIVTAHVAVGSLLLATSLALALYAQRLLAAPQPAESSARGAMEAAV